MYKNFRLLCMVSLTSLFASAQKPALVVGIVIDQMRADYIERFWDKYGDDGFKRLVKGGYYCRNTHYNYIPTYTGPGHASIFTGSTPAIHGIISNVWFDKESGTYVYCVSDSTVLPVGTDDDAGRMSPARELSTTISDELLLGGPRGSRAISLSIKDRAAILPAGHVSKAYWLSGGEGLFVSSTYYTEKLPEWLNEFNERKRVDAFMKKVWNPLLPLSEYTESRADSNKYEVPFPGEHIAAFPYDLSKYTDRNLIKSTPFGNTLLRELAEACLEGEALGRDETPDFLTISFSSTDYVGHSFGPKSVELEDTYLRLDLEVAAFLKKLDEVVGRKRYVVFLTADHGAGFNPDYLNSNQLPGGYLHYDSIANRLNGKLASLYGDGSYVRAVVDGQVFLAHDAPAILRAGLEKVRASAAEYCMTEAGIAMAMTPEILLAGASANPVVRAAQLGYNQKRSGDLLLIALPGYLEGAGPGTTHGSPFDYDTHVPLIWYGNKIQSGVLDAPVFVTDIAPTVCRILGISFPSGCIGNPLPHIVAYY